MKVNVVLYTCGFFLREKSMNECIRDQNGGEVKPSRKMGWFAGCRVLVCIGAIFGNCSVEWLRFDIRHLFAICIGLAGEVLQVRFFWDQNRNGRSEWVGLHHMKRKKIWGSLLESLSHFKFPFILLNLGNEWKIKNELHFGKKKKKIIRENVI